MICSGVLKFFSSTTTADQNNSKHANLSTNFWCGRNSSYESNGWMDTLNFSFKRSAIKWCVLVEAFDFVTDLERVNRSSFWVLVTVLSLNMSLVVSATPLEWVSRLSLEDNLGNVAVLEFGYDINATDHIDPALDEVEMPPAPPRDVFYAVWSLPKAGNSTLRDLRATPAEGDSLIFYLTVQFSGMLTIAWEADQLGRSLRAAVLSDLFGGKVVHIDMFQHDRITLENNNLRQLKVVIYPRTTEPATHVSATHADNGLHSREQYTAEPVTIFPNPGNNEINFRFDLPLSETINVSIFNSKGQKIRQLNKQIPITGESFLSWDGRTDHNHPVASGVYWVLVRSPRIRITKSLVFLR